MRARSGVSTTPHADATAALLLRFSLPTMARMDEKREADLLILIEAFQEFRQTGQCTAECGTCGQIIEIESLSQEVWKSSCGCGRFNDTFRGL
jgi:hypothetical protein